MLVRYPDLRRGTVPMTSDREGPMRAGDEIEPFD
jgi:hypothetical protein